MPDAKKLFETLVREHADMLTIYLSASLGDRSDVDDLFQETMMVAWRRLDDFDHTRPFGPWLRGIARRLVLAHGRKQPRNLCDPAVLDQLDTRLDQIRSLRGDTWREKLEAVDACVRSLPEHYRVVVQQRYFEHRAIRQVSAILELSTSAVKKRLQRARALVLECVKGKLGDLEFLS